MTRSGSLIVIEGPDGVGKSIISTTVSVRLADYGIPCRMYAFPGNEVGTLGHLVYQLHHEPSALNVKQATPLALQTAHIAAHLDLIERVFQPALKSGTSIVLDRYWWSTFVYGLQSGISRSMLDKLIEVERLAWSDIVPLIIFQIDCDRPWRKSEDNSEWYRIAEEYRKLAGRESNGNRVEVVDNRRSFDTVVAEISETVAKAIGIDIAEKRKKRDHGDPQSLLLFPTMEAARPMHQSAFFIRTDGPRPTKVFDTFWRFAAERQEIFFRRLAGRPWPWSGDPILQRHRFTNAYRASDRVSQFLIRSVQYRGEQSPTELFFRTILFKLFNKIETWQVLMRKIGEPHSADFHINSYMGALDELQSVNQRIYSAAYIMPPAPGARGIAKHVGHLRLLKQMMKDCLPERLAETSSMKEAFEILHAYPMMGNFLAFQYMIDLNYSNMLDFSEMEFVVAGPGARSGIGKCFSDIGNYSYEDVIRYVTENQVEEFKRRDIVFRDLWGRPLQLVDVQNLFCEVDKYSRIAHPDMNAKDGRKRIKQIFRPYGPSLVPWYPPKWGLNEIIQ